MADTRPPEAPPPGAPLPAPMGAAGAPSDAPGFRLPLLAALGLGTPLLWLAGHIALTEWGYGGRGPTLAWILITFAVAVLCASRAHAAAPILPLAVLVMILLAGGFALNQFPPAHRGLERCFRCGDRRDVRTWLGRLQFLDVEETPVSRLHDAAFGADCPHQWTPTQGWSENLFGGVVESESPAGAAIEVSYSRGMPQFYRRCPHTADGEKALDTIVRALQHASPERRLAASRHLGTAFYDDLAGMESTGRDWAAVWSRHAPLFEKPETIH